MKVVTELMSRPSNSYLFLKYMMQGTDDLCLNYNIDGGTG